MLKIDAAGSHERLHTLRFRLPTWVFALALSAAAATFLSGGWTGRDANPAITVIETAPATSLAPPADADAWTRRLWWETPHPLAPIWIRFSFDGGAHGLRDPALAVSGTFSAKVWIHGELAGSKGAPAFRISEERPGPIDAVLPLGKKLKTGENEILLLISASHAGYRPGRLFHDLDLREYTPDARRKPQHYLIAATQAGLLLGLGALFWRLRRNSSYPRATLWAVVAAFAALGALAAESSRTVVNYAYSWQGERQFAVWSLLMSVGLAINFYCAARFRQSRLFALAGAAGALAVLFFVSGADVRVASGFACLTLSAVAMLLLIKGDERMTAFALAACLAPWALFAMTNAVQFVDNGVYLMTSLALAFVAADAVRSPPRAAADQGFLTNDESPGALKIGGEIVPVEILRAAHAAGNYSELELNDGTRRLIRVSLATIMENAPAELVRVHRSHIVNTIHARRLRAEKGSRYKLVLDDGSTVPVSRNLAGAVRRMLADVRARPPRSTTDEKQEQTSLYSRQ